METKNERQVVIPMEEYEALKSEEAAHEKVKKDILDECRNMVYGFSPVHEHNLKGIGIFGLALGFGGALAAAFAFHAAWYYVLPIFFGLLAVFGKALDL